MTTANNASEIARPTISSVTASRMRDSIVFERETRWRRRWSSLSDRYPNRYPGRVPKSIFKLSTSLNLLISLVSPAGVEPATY